MEITVSHTVSIYTFSPFHFHPPTHTGLVLPYEDLFSFHLPALVPLHVKSATQYTVINLKISGFLLWYVLDLFEVTKPVQEAVCYQCHRASRGKAGFY